MYIKRDNQGDIIAVSESQDADFHELADDQDPEFVEFLKCEVCRASVAESTLKQSDTELVRVLEDVINLLSEKGIIQFTDLPKAAQDKLLNRQSLRQNHRSLHLLSDNEDDDTLTFL